MRPTEKFAYFKAAGVFILLFIIIALVAYFARDYANILPKTTAKADTANSLSVSNQTEKTEMAQSDNQIEINIKKKTFKGSGAHPIIIVVFSVLFFLVIRELLKTRL